MAYSKDPSISKRTVPGRKVKEEGAMVVIEHYDLGDSLAVGGSE
jgi:hypothetical protein